MVLHNLSKEEEIAMLYENTMEDHNNNNNNNDDRLDIENSVTGSGENNTLCSQGIVSGTLCVSTWLIYEIERGNLFIFLVNHE